MNVTLQSDDLQIAINPIGMELSSIRSRSTNLEYIWQGDPAIWKGQAPVLFPIIGALKDGFAYFDGNKYEIPKHGFVRHSDKPKLIGQTENSLKFRLIWDNETLRIYPFEFQLDITFTLSEKVLEVTHEVSNLGKETMPYSLGAHPAFNCPLRIGETYEDYRIEFPQSETDATWLIDQQGLIKDQTKPFLNNSTIIPLSKDLFDNDALIFKHLKSREASLSHREKGAVLTVKFEDFDYLGIWAKPAAPFVCIEPWMGIADSTTSSHEFIQKEGISFLAPNSSETKSYTITVA
ncbi:aldose 1-epimerase family protein [Algoriphagus sp. AGSA1]|uniref:aldose 1-epimerase family protein n=1 Tax=Algoriphagus sp. AGSA1 TaxID=2907213 RepID=UPI001F4913F3|nr:aldose 1-epimerase family protein [Algoriphagus sp. AGSA1]MCE7058165.1 aldose 1-epimerase family protein [Algoriphagus sp. AGSA1]